MVALAQEAQHNGGYRVRKELRQQIKVQVSGKEHKEVGWWLGRDMGLPEGVVTRADTGARSWLVATSPERGRHCNVRQESRAGSGGKSQS